MLGIASYRILAHRYIAAPPTHQAISLQATSPVCDFAPQQQERQLEPVGKSHSCTEHHCITDIHAADSYLGEREHMHHVRCIGAVVRLPRKQEVLVRLIYDQPGSCICCDPCQPIQRLTGQSDTCNCSAMPHSVLTSWPGCYSFRVMEGLLQGLTLCDASCLLCSHEHALSLSTCCSPNMHAGHRNLHF